ncbi:hypothetical protein [Candidatus Magnetominusculus dajiuhuensis]
MADHFDDTIPRFLITGNEVIGHLARFLEKELLSLFGDDWL